MARVRTGRKLSTANLPENERIEALSTKISVTKICNKCKNVRM